MHPVKRCKRSSTKAPPRVVSTQLDLTITGKECKVYQNENLARSLREGGHLIQLSCDNHLSSGSGSWNHGENEKDDEGFASHYETRQQHSLNVLVEKYDARTLMDEFSLQQLCSNQHSRTSFNTDGVINKASCLHRVALHEEGSQEEINQRNIERFGMFSCKFQSYTPTGKPDFEERDGKDGHHSEDVGESGKEMEEEPFEPTEMLRSALRDMKLPRTMRQHNIIELTASRVVENPQLEILLKLREANNNDLSFINPLDDLHQYYLFLKGKCSGKTQATDEAVVEACEKEVSGLGGLLAAYASSSDEESSDRVEESKEDTSIPPEQNEQKRKAERMARLRQWKESKNLTTSDDDNNKNNFSKKD